MSNPNHEPVRHLGLKEGMESFEGTPFVPMIEAALSEAGIDPVGYDPLRYGHDEYCGLPATTPSDRHSPKSPSPIITYLDKAVQSGQIAVIKPALGTVSFKQYSMYPLEGAEPIDPNAWRTSKLATIGMVSFTDSVTGQVLAYGAPLSGDGGREGHAIISTNSVTIDQQVG